MSNRLGDLISRGEGGYNSFNRGSAGDARGATIDFSRMTLGEVLDAQHLPRRDPDRLFAVGKYQVIPGTMDGAVSALRLDRDQRFTPELQERIFSDYLIVTKRPDIHGYVTGQPGVSLHDAQEAAAAEWASVADPDTGRSKYGGIGNNRASISAEQVAGALNGMRQDYQEAIRQGKSPAEAWREVAPHEVSLPQREATRGTRADGLLRYGEHGLAVQLLQESLTKLDYRDAEGRALNADGKFGARTEEALRSFQRDHGLREDGIAGLNTLQALKRAEHTPQLTDVCHRDHAMFLQAQSGVHKLDAHHKRTPDILSDQLAAALVVEAKREGLTRIDEVILGIGNETVIAKQSERFAVFDKYAHVNAVAGLNQPIANSSEQLVQVSLDLAQKAKQSEMQQQSAQERSHGRSL